MQHATMVRCQRLTTIGIPRARALRNAARQTYIVGPQRERGNSSTSTTYHDKALCHSRSVKGWFAAALRGSHCHQRRLLSCISELD